MTKSSLFKIFLLLVVLSPFLAYLFNNGLLAYGPMLAVAILILCFEAVEPTLLSYKEWFSILAFVPYTLIAELYYILHPYEGKILSEYSITFIFLPFFVYIFLVLRRKYHGEDYHKLLFKIIFIFLILQSIVCLGQISTYVLGIGLPVVQEYQYDFMISGTFSNSNDLAAVVLLISLSMTRLESSLQKNIQVITWLIIAFLLMVSSSRSALVCALVIFIVSRNMSIKSIVPLLLILLAAIPILGAIFSQNDSDVLNRISSRIETFQNIYEYGLNADSSINLRLDSYIHFIKNLKNLGMGSGEIHNYYIYATNSNFESWLMFQNPHFLIIEIGYWLGWIGLVSFFSAFLFLIFTYYRSALFLLIAIISMSIPASLLGSSIYFFFLILCVFSAKYSNDSIIMIK